MKTILMVGIGSCIGGILRYFISSQIHLRYPYLQPWGTWIVNIIGCFFIGLVFALLATEKLGQEWKHFLTVGLLGGFTTFSSFSYETLELLQKNEYIHAIIYTLASVLLGLIASFIGYWCVNR